MILRHRNISKYSMVCAENFLQTPIIGNRRTRNLRDTLVKAQLEYPPPPAKARWQEIRPTICQRLGKCTYCPRIKKLNTKKN
jgi:5-methylcytosine-specific restriction endonuclease McrA